MDARKGERKAHSQMTFLDAAQQVLTESEAPLSPGEIVEIAVKRGYLTTGGTTPEQTMKSKLSVDILHKKERSRFMRSGPNTFALREWSAVKEFVADRYQKALFDEDIVVFDAGILRQYFPDNGITQLEPDRGLELVTQTFAMRRLEAEERYDVIQLVSQFLVIHRGAVASHKRTKRLPEARLHGEHSLLFGGHLNPDDIAPLFGPFDPVDGPEYLTRELSEEVRILDGKPTLTLLGGIYDPRRDVSKQHLGVLYRVDVPPHCTIEIGERGFLQQLQFETLAGLGSHIDEFENWSELVYKELLLTGSVAL